MQLKVADSPVQFGISGLRGRVGAELTPELVTRYARAFGFFAGPGRVAVGRDPRVSGPMVFAAAVAGLTGAGCDVIDLGVCPTPTVLHHVRSAGLCGGIVVTASHNPEEWNGLKFAGPAGEFLSPAEFERFRPLVSEPSRPVSWDRCGDFRADPDAVASHIAAITGNELFRSRPGRHLRVGIDAVNGAAVHAAPEFCRAAGAEPMLINCADDRATLQKGFPRRPEPTPDHLADLAELVRREGLDFGIAFDPDGDRAGIIDETGRPLPEEWTLCLACRYVLARCSGPVVTNLSTTRALEDVADEFSTPVFRTPVGEAAVVAGMKTHRAVIGGEGNGGVILPTVNFTRDGLVAFACLLGLVMNNEQPLSGLTAGLGNWRMVRTRLDLDRTGFAARADRLAEAFPEAKLDRQDGIHLTGRDFWLHARPSNTEPLVRIIAEARGRKPDAEIDRARLVLTGGQ